MKVKPLHRLLGQQRRWALPQAPFLLQVRSICLDICCCSPITPVRKHFNIDIETFESVQSVGQDDCQWRDNISAWPINNGPLRNNHCSWTTAIVPLVSVQNLPAQLLTHFESLFGTIDVTSAFFVKLWGLVVKFCVKQIQNKYKCTTVSEVFLWMIYKACF